MKKPLLLQHLTIYLTVILAITSCAQTRSITEQYIKNNIEEHTINEFSSIRTYNIFQSFIGVGTYIEFTGHIFLGKKGLLIGVDRYYRERPQFKGDQSVIAQIDYIDLTEEECQLLLSKIEPLYEKLKDKKCKNNEFIYQDFTVNKDLFVSVYRSNFNGTSINVDLWIYGQKYSIPKWSLVEVLKLFLAYN
jgi:hypothetical protein